MSRVLLVTLILAATVGAVVAYADPEQIARASDNVSELMRRRAASPARAVQIPRGQTGEFALHAKINGVNAPGCRWSCSNMMSTSRPPADTPRRRG